MSRSRAACGVFWGGDPVRYTRASFHSRRAAQSAVTRSRVWVSFTRCQPFRYFKSDMYMQFACVESASSKSIWRSMMLTSLSAESTFCADSRNAGKPRRILNQHSVHSLRDKNYNVRSQNIKNRRPYPFEKDERPHEHKPQKSFIFAAWFLYPYAGKHLDFPATNW